MKAPDSSTHNARGRTLTIPSNTLVETGGVPLLINNNPSLVCNLMWHNPQPELHDGSEELGGVLSPISNYFRQ